MIWRVFSDASEHLHNDHGEYCIPKASAAPSILATFNISSEGGRGLSCTGILLSCFWNTHLMARGNSSENIQSIPIQLL